MLINQEWNGGIPNLNTKASLTNLSAKTPFPIAREPKINTNDANLWEIKYFTPLKIDLSLKFLTNNGIKHSIFISKHTHWVNKLLELIDIKMHNTIALKYPKSGVKNKISLGLPYKDYYLTALIHYSSITLITHLKKVFIFTLSTTIGINLWFAPQISEHCPKYNPGRWMINLSWFRRPGTASAFTPREGTVQEWRTSAEETKTRTCVCAGNTVRLSTSNSRNMPSSSSDEGTMYLSNSNLSPLLTVQKSLYS